MDTDLLVVGVARVRHLAPQREHSVPGVSNTHAYAYMQIYIRTHGYMYKGMCIYAQAAGTLGACSDITGSQAAAAETNMLQLCDMCLCRDKYVTYV